MLKNGAGYRIFPEKGEDMKKSSLLLLIVTVALSACSAIGLNPAPEVAPTELPPPLQYRVVLSVEAERAALVATGRVALAARFTPADALPLEACIASRPPVLRYPRGDGNSPFDLVWFPFRA